MELSNRDRVGRGFELLAEGLEPFVDHHMKGIVPSGMDWLDVFSKRHYKRSPGMIVSKRDPLVLVRVIVEEERAFKGVLSRAERSYAQELWEARNSWAHNSVFNEADTYRLLDTVERLLQAAGAASEADAVQELRRDHRRPPVGRQEQASRPPNGHQASGAAGITPASGPQLTPGPAGERSAFSRRTALVAGLSAGIFAMLTTLGLMLLPSANVWEKALVIVASLAVSVATLTGFGAWRSKRRFTVTAAAGSLALVCLVGLSITAGSGMGREEPAVAGNTRSGSHPADNAEGSSGLPGLSPALVSPSPAAPAGQSVTRSPQYLVNLKSDTDNTSGPQTGSWTMQGRTYAHSIGYGAVGQQVSLTYELTGSYDYFAAVVGVNDDAAPIDHDTSVEFIAYGNPNGGSTVALKDMTAQWGKPELFDVGVRGVTTLTLVTLSSEGLVNPNSIAVWGNARLLISG